MSYESDLFRASTIKLIVGREANWPLLPWNCAREMVELSSFSQSQRFSLILHPFSVILYPITLERIPIRTHLDLSWIRLKPFEFIRIHLNPFASIWIYWNPFQSIWIHLDPFESIWIPLNPFGSLRIHLGPFGLHPNSVVSSQLPLLLK